MPPLSGEEGLKFAQKIWKMITGSTGFDRVLQKVNIISAGNGDCTAEFEVEKELANKMGILHGGCTATMVDCISTMGLMTLGEQKPGITVHLNVNYQRGAKLGSKIKVDTRTLKFGKTLAYLDVVMKEKNSGEIVATGTHIKYVA